MRKKTFFLKTDTLFVDAMSVNSNGNFVISDDEFNIKIGNKVIANIQQQRKNGVREGGVLFLPNTGKVFIIGDLHERFDNLLVILEHIQSQDSTNLDINPQNKIIFNGDIFFPSKSNVEYEHKVVIGTSDTLHGEAMLRLIGCLMVKYPNQVYLINGNHEMGVLLALRIKQEPTWKSVITSFNLTKDLPRKKLGISNIKFLVGLIKNGGIMAKIGNDNELVRIVTHSAGDKTIAHFSEIAKENSPKQWRERFHGVYSGWNGLTPKDFIVSRKAMGGDKLYFGHIDPDTMQAMMNEIAIPVTDRTSPIGLYKGGATFIDSQASNEMSGYIAVNLENNIETVYSMAQLLYSYKPCFIYAKLIQIANTKQSKATTLKNLKYELE